MDAAEKWLEENAIECQRYAMRLSPFACRQYQDTDPARCKGCARLEGHNEGDVPYKQVLKRRQAASCKRLKLNQEAKKKKRANRAKEQTMAKHPVRECADCGRNMKMVARGLCGKCYFSHKNAGTLDERFPAAKPTARKDCAKSASDESCKSSKPLDSPAAVAEKKSFPSEVRPRPDFAVDLRNVMAEIEAGLLAKNAAYGDSALNPVRVFSKADPLEQINVRLDDKLSRLMRGEDAGEDTEGDLLGYLVLKRVALRRRS